MASAWGLAFGLAFGNAWGSLGVAPAPAQPAGNVLPRKRRPLRLVPAPALEFEDDEEEATLLAMGAL